MAESGAFSVVLEAMAEPLAERITRSIPIPTIGIGASVACDGQILVMEDMLGLSPRVPKFVKEFGRIGDSIDKAIGWYAEEVRKRSFPQTQHTYPMRTPRPEAGDRVRSGNARATKKSKTRSN